MKKTSTLMFGAMVATLGLPGLAQDGGADAIRLEEVVVTARKRAEALQDVPLTITAVTSEMIEQAGIRDVRQLSTMTPGFHFENTGSRQGSQARIRGMEINTANPTRQNASFFIDGVYMPGSTQALDFSEFERVEVIKGPQSALFGRQTFGGAINFVTKQPGNDFEFGGAATIGSFGLRELSGSISAPIIDDRLFARVHVRAYDYDGAFSNALDNQKLGAQQSRSGSMSLSFRATDSLRIDLRHMRQQDEDGQAGVVQIGAAGLNCGPFGGTFKFYCGALPERATYRLNTVIAENNAQNLRRFGFDRDSTTTTVKLSWDLGSHELSMSAAQFEESSLSVEDFDLTGVATLAAATYQDFDDRSAEIRLVSTNDNALQYIVGASWYEGKFDSNAFQGNATLSNIAAFSTRLPDTANANNTGFFGSISYRLSDSLRAGAEVRYQQDEVINVGGQGTARRTLSGKTNAVLPRVLLDWKLRDDVMLYGIYSKGNKPKQFNANIAGRAAAEQEYILKTFGVGVALDEEELTNIEIGLKSTLLDGRLLLNAALFQMDWKDQITRRQVFPSPTITTQIDVVGNAGSSKIKGVELETRLAVSERLRLEGTLAHVNAEYTDFNSVNVQQVFGNPQTAGKISARYPKLQWSMALNYEFPSLGDWQPTLRMDQTYKAKRYTDEVNLAYADAYSRTNARLTFERGNVAMALFVDNLADDRGIESATRFRDLTVPGNQFSFPYTLADGRKYGLTLRYRR